MVSITVGQALLLLIEKYQDEPQRLEQLKNFYLKGITAEQRSALDLMLLDPVLSEYTISFSPAHIDEDPSRRYFETHLCSETLHEVLNHIEISEVKAVNAFFYQRLLETFGAKSQAMYSIKCVLDV